MSFEETYKTSYSHGLESIYALETVDVKSIRRLSVQAACEKPTLKSSPIPLSPQFELDFGPGFRHWIEPFLLREPIQVLGLSRPAEKCLQEMKKERLGDLIGPLAIKQGYLDEIAQKFSHYTAGKECHRTFQIDFDSWIRSFFPAIARKQWLVLFEAFGLLELVNLGHGENLELRRLTEEQKGELQHEALKGLRRGEWRSYFASSCDLIAGVFVKPWMERRQGLATEDEIIERLQKRSTFPHLVEPILDFFKVVYAGGNFPLTEALEQVERGLYVLHREAFRAVVECAKSYFKPIGGYYQLTHLISLVEREKALSWQGFAEGYVEKVLKLSQLFRVRKGKSGLEVRLQTLSTQRAGIAQLARFASGGRAVAAPGEMDRHFQF